VLQQEAEEDMVEVLFAERPVGLACGVAVDVWNFGHRI
jgi:hypothetical protein